MHHQFPIQFAGDNGCAGLAPEFRETAAMVEMCVSIQQELNIFRVEAEFLDVGFDLRQHLNMTGIYEDVAFGSRYQERTNQIASDIVDVSDNSSWRKRP